MARAMKAKYTAIGPSSRQITGQSKAFAHFVRSSRHNFTVVCYNTFPNKIVDAIYFVCLIALTRLKGAPTVVYFTNSRSSFGFMRDAILIFLLKKKSIQQKFVAHLHGSDLATAYESSNALSKFCADYVYANIEEMIVLSDAMKADLKQYWPTNMSVVKNFVDPRMVKSRATIEKKIASCKGENVKVYFISNIIPSKGLHILLESFCHLFPVQQEKYKIFVVGSYMCDRTYERYITHLCKNRADISILGPKSSLEIVHCYEAADIMCLPSYYPTEASPLCVLEAQACGALVVTTDQGAIRELLPEDYPFIACAGSSSDFLEKFEQALASFDNSGKLRLDCYANVDVHYNSDRYIDEIDALLMPAG